MKRVTLKDLARELGLSSSTVSRALNGDRNIRPETRERVLDAAKRVGYKPNLAAASMKTGRTYTVGVVVPEMVTAYSIEVIRSVQNVLYAKGVRVVVADSAEDPDREKENLLMMERFMVDGIIYSPCNYHRNRETLERLLADGFPIVCFGRIPYGVDLPKVIVDDYSMSFFVVEKMILSGCRRICHYRGSDEVFNTVERARGYRDAMAKYKLEAVEIPGGIGQKGGAAAAERMIASGRDFDGIYAFNEPVAIGAMNRLRELGCRIPDDISVAAFSGTDLSTVVYPQLTTVEPPTDEMGRVTVELLIEKIKNPAAGNRTVVLNAEIKMRKSTER